MEYIIGEIFKYNGEWYQCVEGDIYCPDCVFFRKKCNSQVLGECGALKRSDKENVIFKKLEKVGKPYMLEDKKFQMYRAFRTPYIYHKIDYSWQSFVFPYYYCVSLEIKQNKEDMSNTETLWYGPDKKEAKSLKLSNLKPFSIEAAKAGKPVCTRDGRKARIICFDLKNEEYPIVAAIGNDSSETLLCYTINGEIVKGNYKSDKDLMMLPEKKEGWVNVYKDGLLGTRVHNTKKEAFDNASPRDYVDTVRISWEESE